MVILTKSTSKIGIDDFNVIAVDTVQQIVGLNIIMVLKTEVADTLELTEQVESRMFSRTNKVTYLNSDNTFSIFRKDLRI